MPLEESIDVVYLVYAFIQMGVIVTCLLIWIIFQIWVNNLHR